MHQVELSGWGKYPVAKSRVRKPETESGVQGSLQQRMIPRGLGRSYGDPAINEGGLVVDMTHLDRFLDFDAGTGVLECEAGVSLEQIIESYAPRGFFPMVTPGTKFVTVGGCIANDVHGKAHHVDGTFSTCVEDFRILLANGEIVRASRTEYSDLFWATFGGLGLTGIILTAKIRLRPIETTYFHQRAIPTKNLDEMLAAMEEADAKYPYSVAWLDSLATGSRLGRGVLTVGDHAKLADLPSDMKSSSRRITPSSPVVVPFDMPSMSLNQFTIRILNVAIETVQRGGGTLAHYEKFFYPLDFVGEWNRGYGRRGFTQWQFVIPFTDGPRRIREILETITSSGQSPFLNVLKRFGKEAQGHLSFPFEGYTFAIDFPVRSGLRELLEKLDAKVLDAGGRIYLGKDAFVQPATLAAMYPRLEEWKSVKAKYDPHQKFQSNLSRRVGLTR